MRQLKLKISTKIFMSFFICMWSIAPILWTFRTSILSNKSLIQKPIEYFGQDYNINNYIDLVNNETFLEAFKNTLIESIGATIGILVISLLAGYSLARYDFIGKKFVNKFILLTFAIPPYAIMIPLYRNMAKIGWIGSYKVLILIYIAAFLPLAVLIMTNGFKSIPIEIEEAARVDGANVFDIIYLLIPLIKPYIIAIGIISFFSSYSQFIFPLIFSSNKTQPLTVLMTQFVSKSSVNYALISAAGILTIIPPIVLTMIFSRNFVDIGVEGAIK